MFLHKTMYNYPYITPIIPSYLEHLGCYLQYSYDSKPLSDTEPSISADRYWNHSRDQSGHIPGMKNKTLRRKVTFHKNPKYWGRKV